MVGRVSRAIYRRAERALRFFQIPAFAGINKIDSQFGRRRLFSILLSPQTVRPLVRIIRLAPLVGK
jgi:hypothetical protein